MHSQTTPVERQRYSVVIRLLTVFAAAVQSSDGKTIFRYHGSTGEGTFPELAEDLGYFERIKLDWLGDTTSGPQSIQSAATGDVEFGSAFDGAVVKLNAAGARSRR